jgi:tetratricopeptide (TPR) repeat protein
MTASASHKMGIEPAVSFRPVKLVAAQAKRTRQEDVPTALHELEALYVYGVLLQLACLAGVEYRDLTAGAEAGVIDPALPADEAIRQMRELCASHRAQGLLVATLALTEGSEPGNEAGLPALKASYRLFDPEGGLYTANQALFQPLPPDVAIRLSVSSPAIEADKLLSADRLNRLISRTVAHLLQALSGEEPPPLVAKAPLSHSLPAMWLLLRAHRAVDPAEKIRLYESALAEDAGLESAYAHLARLYRSTHNYGKSALHYRNALKVARGPARNKAVYATEGGIACALSGKTDVALQWWRYAINADPTYINPYFNLGNTYEDQEALDQAEQAFLQAQQLAPDDFRTVASLARVYSKAGQWEKALAQYQRQLQLEADDAWCYSDIATCYLNLGDSEQARRHLEKTATLDPEGEAGQAAQIILDSLALTLDVAKTLNRG